MERDEEFEHVPWSELAAGIEPKRGRLAYILAGVIVAVAVGAAAARALWPTGGATSADAGAPSVPAGEPVAPDDPPVVSATTIAEAVLYTEADLMAVPPVDATRAAAARAEWFVADYFTADLDPGGSLDVRRVLPSGADVALPQDAPAEGISYVEWARALSVETVAPDLHRVDVAFRAIGGPPDGPLVRLPVRAVRVVVQGDAFGMSIVDLPAPVALPAETGPAPWPDGRGDIPDGIAAAALESVQAWGEGGVVVGGAGTERGWRVMVEVDDAASNRWPLALWLDELGVLATPPWLDPLHSGP